MPPEGAVRALRTALTIAPAAEFRIVHAWWPPRVALGEIDAAKQDIADENKQLQLLIKNAVEEAVHGFPSQGSNVNIDLIENNPYTALSNQCFWADLLVMGTHSKGRLASTVSIGRLAQHLLVEVILRRANIPSVAPPVRTIIAIQVALCPATFSCSKRWTIPLSSSLLPPEELVHGQRKPNRPFATCSETCPEMPIHRAHAGSRRNTA